MFVLDDFDFSLTYLTNNRLLLRLTNRSDEIPIESIEIRSSLFPDFTVDTRISPNHSLSKEVTLLDTVGEKRLIEGRISFRLTLADQSKLRIAKRVTIIKKPKIAVIGAGLAGLTAAYRLVQAGYTPVVYEAALRLGGRCLSGTFPNGQVYEHGAELIDSCHLETLHLIKELGLQVDDLVEGQVVGTQDRYRVMDYTTDPATPILYSFEEAANDYFNKVDPTTGMSVYQRIYTDANETYPQHLGWPMQFRDEKLAREIDRMSLSEYIDRITDFLKEDGSPKLAQLLKVAYTHKYGAEVTNQTPFNLIYLMGFYTEPMMYEPPNVPNELFRLYGVSDERYHIRGGNSQLVDKLVEKLREAKVPIRLRTPLRGIARDPITGAYDLTFDVFVKNEEALKNIEEGNDDGQLPSTQSEQREHIDSVAPFVKIKRTKRYDRVVLTMPFSVMRAKDGVELKDSGFSDLKLYAIGHLEMSHNAKLHVQFPTRYWTLEGNNGFTYDTTDPHNPSIGTGIEGGYQNTWEVSRAQPGKEGILVNFTGGERADRIRTSMFIRDPVRRNQYLRKTATQFIESLQEIVPGSNQFRFEKDEQGNIVNVVTDNWSESPWQRGSYSFWSPGQVIGGRGLIIDQRIEPSGEVVPFAGFEGVAEPYGDPDPNCHFGGEHTSFENQGYVEGAISSGNRCAREVIEALSRQN